MVAVKVWLGGEGPCEIGTRGDGGDQPGVLEALLLRLEPAGWIVGGAERWQYIRKYRAGSALRAGRNHEDIHNVVGLALMAWEAACEVVAFARDTDADRERATAIEQGIAAAAGLFPMLVVVGGVARPAIEGWILALLGVRDTDGMSRQRTLDELAARDIDEKSPAAYVCVVEAWQRRHCRPVMTR